jgi:hypothetical protein
MAAPTFVTSSAGASWDTTTSPKTSGGLTTQSGDLVVSVLGDENDDGNENFTWTSSVTETWTEHTESSGATNGAGFLQSARATCSSAWSAGTVTATRTTGTANRYNHVATVWRSHNGVGNIGYSAELSGTAPSYSFTTSTADSALLVIAVDWNARAAGSRTYTQINGQSAVELAYFNNTAAYTIYVFYFADVGAAGAKTIQINNISASADLIYHAVEIKGAAGSTPIAGTETGAGADTGTVAPAITGTDTGAGAETGSLAAAATGADTAASAEASSIGLGGIGDTGTGSDAGTLAAALAGADSAAAADSGSLAASPAATDTGAGADAATLVVNVTASDAAAGVDAATVDTGSGDASKTGSDTATGTEAGATAATTTAADTATATDTATVSAARTAADTATATESATVTVILAGSDVATATDLAALAVAVAAAELAATLEAASWTDPNNEFQGRILSARLSSLLAAARLDAERHATANLSIPEATGVLS